MDTECAIEYGETLLDYAFDILFVRNTCGVNHAEFIFERLVSHLNEYPALRQWFLKNVESTLRNEQTNLVGQKSRPEGFIPSELVEYVAHCMRWPEFKELAQREISKHPSGDSWHISRNLPTSILDAMKEDWEDVDMYPSLDKNAFAPLFTVGYGER